MPRVFLKCIILNTNFLPKLKKCCHEVTIDNSYTSRVALQVTAREAMTFLLKISTISGYIPVRLCSGQCVCFAVGRPGVQFPCRVIPKDFKKMVSIASLLGARSLWEVVENKLASSLVVSFGKAVNWTPPPLCERQVAETPKWQLPSECGLPVQNIAIQFAYS